MVPETPRTSRSAARLRPTADPPRRGAHLAATGRPGHDRSRDAGEVDAARAVDLDAAAHGDDAAVTGDVADLDRSRPDPQVEAARLLDVHRARAPGDADVAERALEGHLARRRAEDHVAALGAPHLDRLPRPPSMRVEPSASSRTFAPLVSISGPGPVRTTIDPLRAVIVSRAGPPPIPSIAAGVYGRPAQRSDGDKGHASATLHRV